MKIISKYILREHIAPFWFGMGIITFAFVMNVAFRDLPRFLGKGIPFWVIAEFFFYNLAWIIALAVPMSVLVSALMTFGQMSADNEIVAFKASGIHLYRLMAPLFVTAIALTFVMERFNNVVLPEFNLRTKQLGRDISQKKPAASLEPNVFFKEIPNYSIMVRDIDSKNDLLKDILIHDNSDHKFTKTITAQKGKLQYVESEAALKLTLFDGEIHEIDDVALGEYHRLQFKKQVVSIPAKNMSLKRSGDSTRGDREKSASMMWEDVRKNREYISNKKKRVHRRALKELRRVFPDSLFTDEETQNTMPKPMIGRGQRFYLKSVVQQIRSDLGTLRTFKKNINKYKVEIHKKYSIPFACIVFALIGAPLGIMSRQGGLAMAGAISLLFYVIYWSCLIGGEQLSDRMYLPPWLAMWMANIIVGTAGIFLVIHSVRETTFIHWEYITDWFRKVFTKRSS